MAFIDGCVAHALFLTMVFWRRFHTGKMQKQHFLSLFEPPKVAWGIDMILIVGGAYQGKTEYAKEHFGGEYRLLEKYHEVIRRQMQEGKNPLLEVRKLLEMGENLVIISDEVGYGLVPMEKEERQYRECVGRVNCFLAGQAEQVIRVVCGIGSVIKET